MITRSAFQIQQLNKKIGSVILLACAIFLLSSCGKEESQLSDGSYEANVELSGGTGRASIDSPAEITVKGGQIFASIRFSSENYDYMIVDDLRYENEAASGERSLFTIPLEKLPCEIDVIADTTAMSVPHEIEYTISFSLKETSFSNLEKTGEWNLSYARQFSVDEYGKYSLLTIAEDEQYLIVPEDAAVPTDVPEGITVLKQPIENTYLVSSSVMDFIREIDALDAISLTGVKESDWYIKEAADAMEEGRLVYAGKYSEPDYELILNEGCQLAIENTMILHNPEVKEKLIELGIPVIVERSSYETHPLGRLEWIKLYGLLFGKEEVANTAYETELKKIEPIMEKEETGRSVAFFYITANGSVNVRKPNDYVPQMIELAGGKYALADILPKEENALSTMNMQFEDFYAAAKDADILIYNGIVDGELESIDELLEKSELFADFKAVANGEVYCAGSNFFQETMGTCDFIEDVSAVFREDESTELRFLKKLD